MSKMSKIYDALIRLQNVCKENEHCNTCPLGIGVREGVACGITSGEPKDWIVEMPDEWSSIADSLDQEDTFDFDVL